MPYVVGTRLTEADRAKLATLCARMQRPASEVVRVLIRTAVAVDGPPVRFDPESAEVCYADA
jgi:hypothetical protein